MYGDAMRRVDINIKQATTLYKATQLFQGLVLSPNNKRLFLWEGEERTSFTEVANSLVVASLEDGLSEIVGTGTSVEDYYLIHWRSDDKVLILLELLTRVSDVWYFDLRTKRLEQSEAEY